MVTDLMQTTQAAAASAEQVGQSSHGRVNIRAVPKAAGNTSSGSNGKGDGEGTTYRHSHIGSSMQRERVPSWGCSDGMGLAGILGTACSLRGVAFSFAETQPRLRQDIVFR